MDFAASSWSSAKWTAAVKRSTQDPLGHEINTMTREADHYAVLGVLPGTQSVVIEAAYQALMQRYAPEADPSLNAAKKRADVEAAYRVLGDPRSRAAYDKTRGLASPTITSAEEPVEETPATPTPLAGAVRTNRPDQHVTGSPGPQKNDTQTAAWVVGGLLAFMFVVAVLQTANSGPSPSNSFVNVDENLTTTDMNATDMNVTDLSAADLNAAEANLSISDDSASVAATNTSALPEDASEDEHPAVTNPFTEDGNSSPAAPAANVGASKAQPKQDIRTIFSGDDYPADALSGGMQGTAQASLLVDQTGNVVGCRILRSTGTSSLDEATCNIIRSRAKFDPARDSSGHPVPDEVTSPPITWRLSN